MLTSYKDFQNNNNRLSEEIGLLKDYLQNQREEIFKIYQDFASDYRGGYKCRIRDILIFDSMENKYLKKSLRLDYELFPIKEISLWSNVHDKNILFYEINDLHEKIYLCPSCELLIKGRPANTYENWTKELFHENIELLRKTAIKLSLKKDHVERRDFPIRII